MTCGRFDKSSKDDIINDVLRAESRAEFWLGEFTKVKAIAEALQVMKDKPLAERMEPLSKYHREIKPSVHVDVYDVLGAFTDHYEARIKPMIDHLIKKLLAGGVRGHKDLRQDMVDVRDTAQRAIDTLDTWV